MARATMSGGQKSYVEDALKRASGGEQTTVSVTGPRTAYEVISTRDTIRPFRLRWTVTAADGTSATFDEWPPLSAAEQEAIDAKQREINERNRAKEAADAELASRQAREDEDRRFAERVAAEVERILAERENRPPPPADEPTPPAEDPPPPPPDEPPPAEPTA